MHLLLKLISYDYDVSIFELIMIQINISRIIYQEPTKNYSLKVGYLVL